MPVWVGRGEAAQEVVVLRVTLSLVVSARCDELRSRLRDEAPERSASQNRYLPKVPPCARSRLRGFNVGVVREVDAGPCVQDGVPQSLRAYFSAKRTAAFRSALRARGTSPFGANLQSWQDNFGDNRGDSRPARKSRSRLYLAFSTR